MKIIALVIFLSNREKNELDKINRWISVEIKDTRIEIQNLIDIPTIHSEGSKHIKQYEKKINGLLVQKEKIKVLKKEVIIPEDLHHITSVITEYLKSKNKENNTLENMNKYLKNIQYRFEQHGSLDKLII